MEASGGDSATRDADGMTIRTFTRLCFAFVIGLATYYFVYWLPFLLIPSRDQLAVLRPVVSLTFAAAACWYAWKPFASRLAEVPIASGASSGDARGVGLPDLVLCVVIGAIVSGMVGFSLGFFGPMIFVHEANQGPLLGILFTGPLGVLLGAMGGVVYWLRRRANGMRRE